MAAVLGDGKSNDMLAGRVMSFSCTHRLSRPAFIPSVVASNTCKRLHWIKSQVIEVVTHAAIFDESSTARSDWNRHLHDQAIEIKNKTLQCYLQGDIEESSRQPYCPQCILQCQFWV
jgi:hypothetical protein